MKQILSIFFCVSLVLLNWADRAKSNEQTELHEIYKDHYLTTRGIKELWSAYSFAMGQRYSEDRFREVSITRTDEMVAAFDKAFPDLLVKLNDALNSVHSPEKVQIEKEKLLEFFKSNPSLNFEIKDDNFDAFQTEINLRASAKSSEIQKHLPTFLSVIYQSNSAAEMDEGYKKVFSSNKSQKAQGLELEVTVPISWWGGDASGAHLVRKWKPMNGALNEIYMISVDQIPPEFANNPLKVFNQGGLEQTFITKGKLYSRYLNNDFDNIVLSYQGSIDSLGLEGAPNVRHQMSHWNVMVFENKLFMVMCKKMFKKFDEQDVKPQLDDLKQECDLLTRNVKILNQ
jgi:hypothetical protein